ncbi:hypothetical protein M3Y97_00297400 [Aphelenchoides bicaudatus]|nr:hypothetical protein M3Y97_00297400 [Aphelenchoides bicaudatus]
MDDDEFEHVEKKRSREFTCFWDIHVQSAAVGIFLLKSTIAISCIVRNIKVEEHAAATSLIIYTLSMFLALIGHIFKKPQLFFPFIVLDVLFKIIFGVFAFGLLLIGPRMIQHLDLFKQYYQLLPFWLCLFMVVLFFLDLYALNIVCRSQRYIIKKIERKLHKTDAINPSTDSTHESAN